MTDLEAAFVRCYQLLLEAKRPYFSQGFYEDGKLRVMPLGHRIESTLHDLHLLYRQTLIPIPAQASDEQLADYARSWLGDKSTLQNWIDRRTQRIIKDHLGLTSSPEPPAREPPV